MALSFDVFLRHLVHFKCGQHDLELHSSNHFSLYFQVAAPSAVTFLESSLKEGSSVSELHRAGLSLLNLGRPIDSAKIRKLLLAASKGDESLLSVGLAFQLASRLTGAENLTPFVERIGDALIQADEVDGRYLQFEGGLGITANIITGVYELAAAANKPTGLTSDQALKFTNYFLSRKSVQSLKGTAELLEVLRLLTTNKYHVPVCVSVYGRSALTEQRPVVSIRVTNVLGKSLGTVTVSAESSAWTGKKALQAVQGDSTLFALNLFESKPNRGAYDITVTVTPSKADARLIGTAGASVRITVLTEISVENAEISVAERDQQVATKTKTLKFPTSLAASDVLEVDYQQKLTLKFSLKDKQRGDLLTAHQVFVQLTNEETKQEIVFVAEPEATSPQYKFDLNVATKAKDFGHVSGKYTLSLIVGDAVIANPFVWKVAVVGLTFPNTSGDEKKGVPKSEAPWLKTHYGAKPEIKHLFREPEVRPPTVISDTFTLLVFLPLLLLFVLWIKIGVNVSNLPLSLSALVFHSSLAAIFGLYLLFWLKLNMFTTLKWLLGVGVVTFLSGHNLLSRLAARREKAAKTA